MPKQQKSLLFVTFLYSAFQLHSAFATSVPSSAEPGVVTRGLEEKRRGASKLENIILPEKESDKQDGASTEKVFVLQQVVLDGATVYDQSAVDQMTSKYTGQKVSFADLNEISRAITRRYREDGYIFSSVVVSPQTITGGVVHMRVVEGKVTDVKITGKYTDANNLIRDFAEKIKSGSGPANSKDLERYLLLIDDLPGITARGYLQPSSTPGGGELIVNIEEDFFEGSASFDNRGSVYLGPYRGTLIGAINSMFNIHDRTTLRGIVTTQTKEMRFADIAHEEQIGSEGFRLKGRAGITETEPGQELKLIELKGSSKVFDLEGLYPWIRSRQFNVNFIGGFNALNSSTDILGVNVAEDHVRSLRAAARTDFTDNWYGVNQLELQLTQGLDVLGATEDGLGRSRSNGEHDFLRTNATITRIQELWGNFSLQLSATGQYSADPLLSSEEFALGGPEFGRAYDTGEITGDSGAAGSVELRYNGQWPEAYIQSYQIYAFYDGGKVWNHAPVVGESESASLTSAGLGVRFNLEQDLTGYIEINKPLTRDVNSEHDDDTRLFFSILKRF